MPEHSNNAILRFGVMGLAMGAAFGGAIYWFIVQRAGAVPPPIALFFCLLAVAANIVIPAAFPSHPLYDMVKKRVDLSSYQLWVGIALIALAWYLGGYTRDWIYAQWKGWSNREPTPAEVLACVHLLILVIYLLPGGAMFPMKEIDAVNASRMLAKTNLLELKMDVVDAWARSERQKFMTARIARALLLLKMEKGVATEAEVELFERLTGNTGQRALPAPQTDMENDLRRMLQITEPTETKTKRLGG